MSVQLKATKRVSEMFEQRSEDIYSKARAEEFTHCRLDAKGQIMVKRCESILARNNELDCTHPDFAEDLYDTYERASDIGREIYEGIKERASIIALAAATLVYSAGLAYIKTHDVSRRQR